MPPKATYKKGSPTLCIGHRSVGLNVGATVRRATPSTPFRFGLSGGPRGKGVRQVCASGCPSTTQCSCVARHAPPPPPHRLREAAS